MGSSFGSSNNPHPSSLSNFTSHQRKKIKGHLVNTNNRSHGLFPMFLPTYSELTSGSWIIDTFSDRFSFNLCIKEKSDKSHIQQLNSMVIKAFSSQFTAIVTLDVSIKNDITTSISHTHTSNQPLIKTIHHAAFVTSTEAEMFAIKYSINQATAKSNVSKIVVITNSIHAAKKIFNPSSYLLQIQLVAILKDLHLFFSKDPNNSIMFWECPSHLNWYLYKTVDLEIKVFYPTLSFSSKTSWDYSKKVECNDIANIWKIMFQALNGKGKQFLKLRDDDSNNIEPSYIKGSL